LTHHSSLNNQQSTIVDPIMREVLRGFLSAHDVRTTLIFTGRYRWAGFEALPLQNRLDVQLPGLTMRQAVLLMNALPRLKAAPLSDQLQAYARVGGHPKTLELLDGWLAAGSRSLRALLDDPALGGRLAEEWEAYFLNDLLARLSPAERDALTTLAILEEPFWWEMARDLLAVPPRPLGEGWGEGEIQSLLSHLLDLSLIQFHAAGTTAPWYTLHPVVREYLLHPLTADGTRRDLHLRAAAFYGAPFVEVARQVAAESGETLTDAQIEQLARHNQGIVGTWVRQTEDMDRVHWSMDRALQWQHHLFQAGQVGAANDIANAVIEVLTRWGQRDLAKSLLRRDIDSLESAFTRAVAQGNLATLLKNEGRLVEALQVYEDVYQTFATLDAKLNMAATLSQISIVYQHMGDTNRAIEKQQASLQIGREIENEEGQAVNLHQLSTLYREKKDYGEALAHSQQAEELARKIKHEAGLAKTLHEQGLIFNCLNRQQDAFERFNGSLKINRRIGDESGMADNLGELGKLYQDAGLMHEAISAFNEALEICQRQGNPKMAAVLTFLGSIHEKQGEYAAALEKYQQALAIDEQFGSPRDVEIDHKDIARVRGKMGR
jgi:tetratricopeptide (TPR) repeat protein